MQRNSHWRYALSTLFATAAAAAAFPATQAAEGKTITVSGAQAPIQKVLLYPGVASVERVARISAGTRQLTFECLPAAIDVESLQVSADAHVRIGDYKTLLQPRDVAGKACASPLDTQIRGLEDQLAALHADETAAGLVDSYLQGLTKPAGDDTKVPAAKQISATSDALRTTSRDNALRAHQTQRQKELIEEQLNPLLIERERTGALRAQVLRVTVQLATNTDAAVRLNYQVRGPSWQPSYRAQLDVAKKQVQLERQALVVQSSGEDWSNVQLLLSTGQPGRTTQARLPRPWTLDTQQPRPVVAAAAAPVAPAMERQSSVTLYGTVDTQSAPLPQLDVSSINTAYSTQFAVPYQITVPASSERVTLSLGSQSLPASLLTRSAPAVEESAYLVANLAAPPGVWPAGPVALFRDTAFVGNGRLDFGNAQALQQGLSFGRDEQVLVRQLPIDQASGSGGFISGKTERKVAHRYAITNRHSNAITLQVLEAAPVARNDKITVKSQFNPEPRTQRWNEQAGMVEWQQALAAGATAEFSATHEIRYPQDLQVDESQ
ncbi:MAG: DUF4139 domain-containing protein [Comamonas sp.]